MFRDTGYVIKMFCLYCTEYQGLDVECRKGIRPTDLQRALECTDYQYNTEVKCDD